MDDITATSRSSTAASRALTTRICARIVGPFLVLTAFALFSRYEALPIILPSFAQDAQLLMITGAFTTIAGLTLLAFHHHFDTPAATALTLIAGLTTVRGVTLCAMPDFVIGVAMEVAHAPAFILIVIAAAALIGAWLTFVGWFAKPA